MMKVGKFLPPLRSAYEARSTTSRTRSGTKKSTLFSFTSVYHPRVWGEAEPGVTAKINTLLILIMTLLIIPLSCPRAFCRTPSIGRRPLRNRRDVAEQEPLCSSHYVLLWKHRQVLGLRNIGEWFVPPITRFLPHANSTHVPGAADATNYMA